MQQEILLTIENLCTYFQTEAGTAKAVDGVSFKVYKGEVLGIVGESGSGKSVTALSITRLIPNPPGKIVNGSIVFKGKDLLTLDWEEMYTIRGKEISMIFQEPMTSLNPSFTIEFQLKEAVASHATLSKTAIENHVKTMLNLVGIADVESRLNNYPHQFSGGMRQRIMIAMALLNNPSLLIADEPTTALDVTIQAQILELMLSLKAQRHDAAIMLITHDLAVIAQTCDRVIVMYGGKIQESACVFDLFKKPFHPYTKGLLASIPRPDLAKQRRLPMIRGSVPPIFAMPPGCKFSTRCDFCMDKCRDLEPELVEIEDSHFVRCHLFESRR